MPLQANRWKDITRLLGQEGICEGRVGISRIELSGRVPNALGREIGVRVGVGCVALPWDNAFQTWVNAPLTEGNAPLTRVNAPLTAGNAPLTAGNALRTAGIFPLTEGNLALFDRQSPVFTVDITHFLAILGTKRFIKLESRVAHHWILL